jgi:hypothetical protein
MKKIVHRNLITGEVSYSYLEETHYRGFAFTAIARCRQFNTGAKLLGNPYRLYLIS